MKNIYFRKILEYDPTFGGKYDKYHGYERIGKQKLDPGILVKQTTELDIPNNISLPVFSSTLNRSLQTIYKYFERYNVHKLREVKEIKFNLNNLLSEDEYIENGSDLVRERFIESFIADNLAESRTDIKKRIDKLLAILQALDEGKYLIVSHSFFMKILESYLSDNRLFSKPEILAQYLVPKRKTYNFGEGFDLEVLNNGEFVVK